MRAVTWTQIAQYIVLIVAYLVPIVILSTQHYGIPIPELTYGKAIAQIGEREMQLVKDGLAVLCNKEACPPGTLRPHIQPFMCRATRPGTLRKKTPRLPGRFFIRDSVA